MQVIYINEPHVWVDVKQFKSVVLAQVGSTEELYDKELFGTGKYYWSVALDGGDAHPLWGENKGSADTIKEAKDAATRFLKRISINAITII